MESCGLPDLTSGGNKQIMKSSSKRSREKSNQTSSGPVCSPERVKSTLREDFWSWTLWDCRDQALEDGKHRLRPESEKKTRRLQINLTLEPMSISSSQCDSVVVSVESLLNDAKRMQLQCRERSEQLSLATMQLRVESAALREQCETAQLDMARIRRQLDELLDTKAAFEARERQARKLSKQL